MPRTENDTDWSVTELTLRDLAVHWIIHCIGTRDTGAVRLFAWTLAYRIGWENALVWSGDLLCEVADLHRDRLPEDADILALTDWFLAEWRDAEEEWKALKHGASPN